MTKFSPTKNVLLSDNKPPAVMMAEWKLRKVMHAAINMFYPLELAVQTLATEKVKIFLRQKKLSKWNLCGRAHQCVEKQANIIGMW